MDLAQKIEELLKDDHMDQQAAIRLILLSQSEIIKRLAVLEDELERQGHYQSTYPTVTWLLIHRRRPALLLIALIVVILYLLSPADTAALAAVIAKALGIP